MNTTEYKMRAEFIEDFLKVLKTPINIQSYTVTNPNYRFPDVDIEFTSPEDIGYIRDVIQRLVVDSHVMYESLDYKVDYTGERKQLPSVKDLFTEEQIIRWKNWSKQQHEN